MFESHLKTHRSKGPLLFGGALALVALTAVFFLPMPHAIETTYTLAPVAQTTLSVDRGGVLSSLTVGNGDLIAKGAVIGKLDVEGVLAEQAALEQEKGEKRAQAEKLGLLEAKQRVTEANDALANATDESRAELEVEAASAEKALDRVRAKPNLAELEERLAVIDAALQELQLELQQSTLVAPASGRVAGLNLKVGDALTKGQQVLAVDETATLKVLVSVPPEEPTRKGQPLTVELPGGKRLLTLEHEAVDGQAWALLENPANALTPGLEGSATLEGEQRSLLLGLRESHASR